MLSGDRYTPSVIVPTVVFPPITPSTDQVTVWSVVPLTVALNVTVWPAWIVALVGTSVTLEAGGGGGGGGGVELPFPPFPLFPLFPLKAPPPHAVARARISTIAIVSETFVARRVFANSIIVSLSICTAAFQMPTAKTGG